MAARWPAGLHVASGTLPATGYRPQRARPTPQRHYWRQTETELHAGAVSQIPLIAPGIPLQPPSTPSVAAVGPQAAGERWHVDLVQVQQGTQFGQPPQVIQQLVAQRQGVTSAVPPPVVAQAWLCHAGMALAYQLWQTGKLLAQTTQGGNDSMSVSCPPLTAGEVIAVVWYGWAPGVLPFMSVRGTRYALSAT